jgi:hypothetical protein
MKADRLLMTIRCDYEPICKHYESTSLDGMAREDAVCDPQELVAYLLNTDRTVVLTVEPARDVQDSAG